MTWCDLRSWGSFKDSSYLTVLLISSRFFSDRLPGEEVAQGQHDARLAFAVETGPRSRSRKRPLSLFLVQYPSSERLAGRGVFSFKITGPEQRGVRLNLHHFRILSNPGVKSSKDGRSASLRRCPPGCICRSGDLLFTLGLLLYRPLTYVSYLPELRRPRRFSVYLGPRGESARRG